ncbi:unnamed protein product, partial [Ectocarpus sp. 8 AP-2014]
EEGRRRGFAGVSRFQPHVQDAGTQELLPRGRENHRRPQRHVRVQRVREGQVVRWGPPRGARVRHLPPDPRDGVVRHGADEGGRIRALPLLQEGRPRCREPLEVRKW